MSISQQVTYSLDFDARHRSRKVKPATTEQRGPDVGCVSRIARLLALAIRMEGLVREGEIRDYAAVASLGCVTRARVSQILKLLNLAPDIQEQILFLPPIRGLNERTLRPISKQIDWDEQRRLFQGLARRSFGDRELANASFTTSTGSAAASSRSLKSRPFRSGNPISPK
jgi:hypothetical protein